MPFVSVIIPFYNGIDWLCEAVRSVLAQTFSDYEIIIVNDGSPENIADFLGEFGDNEKISYYEQSNRGPAGARNFGIEISRGKYVAFLDSDDLWLPDKLEKQVRYMEENDLIWAHTRYILFGKIRKERFSNNLKYFGNIYPLCLLSCRIASPTVMIRSEVLQGNPKFRFEEGWRTAEDILLWTKLAKEYPVGYLFEPLSKVRLRGNNAAGKVRIQLEMRFKIYKLIKEKKIACSNRNIIILISIPYFLCSIIYNTIHFIEDKLKLSERKLEAISKVLYVIPFSLFKLLGLFMISKRE